MSPLQPCALAIFLVTAGCTTALAPAPSLAPRAAEAIDPRVPVVATIDQRPVDRALAAQLAGLIGQARSGEGPFTAAAGDAQRLAASAGPPQSETWVVAQEALSAAVAARAPTTRALSDIDAIAGAALAKQGGLTTADLAAIEAAAAEVGEIDRRQAETVDALQKRLGG